MTMTDPKSFTGVLTVPRSRLSIVVVVAIGAMALFLTAASLLLASYPVTISPQQDIVIRQPTSGGSEGVGTGGGGSGFGTGSSNNGRKDGDDGSGVDSGPDGREEGGTGGGSEEAKGGSESGTESASEGRKGAGVGDDDSEVKSGNDAGVGEEGGKEVVIDVGSGDVGTGDGSEEVKSGTESGADSASEGRKGVGVGDDGSEVKSGSNGRNDAVVGEEGGKEVVTDDGSVSVNGDGDTNYGKENLPSGSENESGKASSENDLEKAGSGTQDDGSALLDAAKEGTVSPSESEIDSATTSSKSCDLYQGKWIYDPVGPLYTNNTCPIITQMQNCQGNLRPDKEYENYRWKPDQCDLPRFSPRKFLELMRGKTLAFIGDSVARNQMESMLSDL
ncbi:protein YLS7-like [Iris pallida]|uniref:Protein YLS7-like n=1 Tax=Iris pallida TaxID=29817 RepID=A0AAX6EP03_IRIPA|nr:protein YLS7-like [Iris pallida]